MAKNTKQSKSENELTLLDKALAVPSERTPKSNLRDREILELAIAYAENRVTDKQIKSALGVPYNIRGLLASRLLKGIRQEEIKIVKVA